MIAVPPLLHSCGSGKWRENPSPRLSPLCCTLPGDTLWPSPQPPCPRPLLILPSLSCPWSRRQLLPWSSSCLLSFSSSLFDASGSCWTRTGACPPPPGQTVLMVLRRASSTTLWPRVLYEICTSQSTSLNVYTHSPVLLLTL